METTTIVIIVLLVIVIISLFIAAWSLSGTGTTPQNRNTNNPNWMARNRNSLLFLIGPIVAIILIHMIVRYHLDGIWNVWMGSFAFWISLVAIATAVILNFLRFVSSSWYYILLVIIPIFVTYLEFKNNPVVSKDPPASGLMDKSKPQVPDTTETQINGVFITTVLDGGRFRVMLEPNSEVSIRGNGFEKKLTTDSLGIQTDQIIKGDPERARVGSRVLFEEVRGEATVREWRVF
ncbi:hypothetical protein A3J61_00325 [Candidatus Nomurabacteria bacterium RIFCSPHIGHO2_02_FULL_38_15]|uniref:Uncharacterized protein n=1 Tax=Candidatus Nomurabacteria bacterium RIFCSPHIGHO2_02_FULL_38_15 TaxID=1801752 RepID=A0A1F6VRY1_9BACT|nr:MAG: hypothetical protein A3J61_00325 [Candidatus Nomurabacteria bacterium RIFCSPHIGHO2_02_FULL_38_15]